MKNKRNRQVRSGFSMVELMAVIIILGLLAAVVANNVLGKVEKAKVTTTRTNLKTLHSAVQSFRLDTGDYPTEDDGLFALIEAPPGYEDVYPEEGYLEYTELPLDAWGNEFIFELYPESGKPFVIRSLGPDKELDTEDDLLSTDSGNRRVAR